MSYTNVWPKDHACGAMFDQDEWEKLPYVGVQQGDEEIGLPDLEMRSCTCDSTIAIVCPRDINKVKRQ